MPEIVFTTRLTPDDWDEAMHGWRCQVLNVPGAVVEAMYVEGNRVDTARYEVQTQYTFIRWIASDRPQRAVASIKLTETLSLGKETERWKRLAIVLPVVATVVAAVISGAATYFSRAPDVHARFGLASPPGGTQKGGQVSPPTSDGHAVELGRIGSAIDVIDAENTDFSHAFSVELGRNYLSRFRNDDLSLYFGFQQQAGAHDINIDFALITPDTEVQPMLSIYSKSRTKLFSRWHERTDGSSIRWTAPVTPGDYILEITPNGASSNFTRFLLSLNSG